jgi:hypothetical protein
MGAAGSKLRASDAVVARPWGEEVVEVHAAR